MGGYRLSVKFDAVTVRTIIFEMTYFVLLSIVYVTWINPHWGYYGFNLSYSTICLVLATVFNFFLSYESAKLIHKNRLSDQILLIIINLYYIPQGTLFGFQNNDVSFYTFVVAFAIITIILNKIIDFNAKEYISNISSPVPLFETAMIILALIMVAISGLYSGFRISFDLSDYYEYRADYRLYALPHIFRMLFHWAQTLLPIGLLYSLRNKRRFLACFIAIANVLCFSFNGKKSVLFIVVLVILIQLFYREDRIKSLPLILNLSIVASFVEMLIRNGDSFIATQFIRRMIFIPPYLGNIYFNYFQEHELDYLRSSILRRFGLTSPYPEGIPVVMGQVVYGRVSNANTGLCGDAFANFGWLSLLIYPLVIVITFKLLERLSRTIDDKMKFLISFLIAYTFISGSYFTNLWTNGILILGLLMYTYPNITKIEQK